MDGSNHLHPSTEGVASFTGAHARLWCFSPTHDSLAVELTSSSRVAYLVLTGCSAITLPVSWICRRPELVFDPTNCAAPVTFVDGSDVRIACDGATLQDHDPLHAAPPDGAAPAGRGEHVGLAPGGYQLVEPAALDDLLTRPGAGELGAAILGWVLACAREGLGDVLAREGAELEVVRVEYLGSYPALGLRYSREGTRDLGPTVASFVDELVRTRSAFDLIAHLGGAHGADR